MHIILAQTNVHERRPNRRFKLGKPSPEVATVRIPRADQVHNNMNLPKNIPTSPVVGIVHLAVKQAGLKPDLVEWAWVGAHTPDPKLCLTQTCSDSNMAATMS